MKTIRLYVVSYTKKLVLIAAAILAIGLMTLDSPFACLASSVKDQAKSAWNDSGGSTAGTKDLAKDVATPIINNLFFFAGVLAVGMLVYSGLRYITAHGDKTQIESAKNTMIYAIVGLVVVMLSYAVVNFITGVFAK